MICQRCGKCCCNSLVIVIHPDFVKEKLNLCELTKEAFLFINGKPCPHLTWDGDIAICKIHHYDWYKDTPCYSHGQIEYSINDPCRTGVWIRENKIDVKDKFYKNINLKKEL